MPIFIKFPDLQGNATARDYQDWINVKDARFDIGRTDIVDGEDRADPIQQQSFFRRVRFTKLVDDTSKALSQIAYQGNVINQVELRICARNYQLLPYLKYTFDNVIIANHQKALLKDGIPIENFQLRFNYIHSHFIGRDGVSRTVSPFIISSDQEKLAENS